MEKYQQPYDFVEWDHNELRSYLARLILMHRVLGTEPDMQVRHMYMSIVEAQDMNREINHVMFELDCRVRDGLA